PWVDGVRIGDEVAERGSVLPHRSVQRRDDRDRLAPPADAADAPTDVLGDRLARGGAGCRPLELAFGSPDPCAPIRGPGWDPDRLLVDDRVGQRVTDPPDRIGGELQASAMVELLDGADQADRALLDEILVGRSTPAVPLRQRMNQPQVPLDHLLLGSEVTTLDALGERDLLGGREPAGHLMPPRRASDAVRERPRRRNG